MCGRIYNIIPKTDGFETILGNWPDGGLQSYNIAPTKTVPIITQGGTIQARWGLIPSWSEEFKSKYSTFNARVESVQEKIFFKNTWKAKRSCVVPIGGYYEWKKEESCKQPYAISYEEKPMFLAGLWERWKEHYSFTVLTQQSAGGIQWVHDRMPVVLDPISIETWINDFEIPENRTSWADEVSCFMVSKSVNNPKNRSKHLLFNV